MRRAAFTLIELLIVIAILAVLAALLLPVLSSAKERSRQTFCASNLRQIAMASVMFADDFETLPWQAGDGLPVKAVGGDGTNYYDLLLPYVLRPQLWLCPSTRDHPGSHMSYHMNGFLITSSGLNPSAIQSPATTLLIGEGSRGARWDRAYLRPDQEGGYLYDKPQLQHRGGGNATFADGHVLWHHDRQWNSNSFTPFPSL